MKSMVLGTGHGTSTTNDKGMTWFKGFVQASPGGIIHSKQFECVKMWRWELWTVVLWDFPIIRDGAR
jgi:hypothetical protein